METREITIILMSHRRLSIWTVYLSPYLDAMLSKHSLLVIPAEMLTNHHCIRIYSMDCIVISLEHIDTELVILRTLSIIISRICLCKTLGQVKAEAVNLVLLKKIFQTLLDMKLDKIVAMIHIPVYIVRVFRNLIEPWVIEGCTAVIEIHLHQRAIIGKVVIYHIKEDSNISAVALIDESLILFSGSIILIKGEIEIWVISPSVA